jgi:hypothetical protein
VTVMARVADPAASPCVSSTVTQHGMQNKPKDQACVPGHLGYISGTATGCIAADDMLHQASPALTEIKLQRSQ